jgi:two-component system sensor histidine kinase UhpB
MEDVLYWIALEALTNVAKHSGAKRASLLLERRDHELHLIVEDDGHGFDVMGQRTDGSNSHLGLIGIQERAALLDGTLTVESRPGGGGTTLFVRIPLERNASA